MTTPAPRTSLGSVPGARSTTGLATAVTLLLMGCCVTALVSGFASWRRAGTVSDVLAGEDVSDARLSDADQLVGVSVIVDAVLTVVTGVVFIIWFWRLIKNAQLLNAARPIQPGWAASGTTAVPAAGWAIASWLIPLANFVLPGYFLSRVDSVSGSEGRGARPVIVAWAVTWGLVFLASNVVWRGSDENLTALETADRRDVWLQLLYVVAAILAITMVRKITSRQQEAIGGGISPG